MKASRLSQKIHKWLGLLVGIQLLIWTFSGFYMVVVDIDIIHGDHLVKPVEGSFPVTMSAEITQSLQALAAANPDAVAISLKQWMGKPVYQITDATRSRLVAAPSGQPLPALNRTMVSEIAMQSYAGNGSLKRVDLISDNPPSEIGSRQLPLWRADFDDLWGTSFYISPQSGELVTRRHTLWRVFDFLWMLHIMDYGEREDINNSLLRVISALALLLVLSGIWYLYFRLNVRALFRRT